MCSEETVTRLELELSQLQTIINNKEKTVREKEEEIANYQVQQQHTQQQQSQLTQQRQQQQQQHAQFQVEVKRYKDIIHSQDSQIAEIGQELATAEKQCLLWEKKMKGEREEGLEVKKRLAMNQHEVETCAQDLMLMTKENQAVTAGDIDCM